MVAKYMPSSVLFIKEEKHWKTEVNTNEKRSISIAHREEEKQKGKNIVKDNSRPRKNVCCENGMITDQFRSKNNNVGLTEFNNSRSWLTEQCSGEPYN